MTAPFAGRSHRLYSYWYGGPMLKGMRLGISIKIQRAPFFISYHRNLVADPIPNSTAGREEWEGYCFIGKSPIPLFYHQHVTPRNPKFAFEERNLIRHLSLFKDLKNKGEVAE